MAVGSDEVAGAEGLGRGMNCGEISVNRDTAESVLPVKTNSKACGTIQQNLVEDGAANAASGASRKVALHGRVAL